MQKSNVAYVANILPIWHKIYSINQSINHVALLVNSDDAIMGLFLFCMNIGFQPVSYIYFTLRLESPDAMFKSGLYINDLSMHDSSRDLVLAGTQQSAELKLALDQVRNQHRSGCMCLLTEGCSTLWYIGHQHISSTGLCFMPVRPYLAIYIPLLLLLLVPFSSRSSLFFPLFPLENSIVTLVW